MDTLDSRKRERFWNQLLDLIAKGTVVPVVGEELLQLSNEPEPRTLYPELARRFGQACDITIDDAPKGNLSATVRRHPDFRDNPYGVYQDLTAEYEEWKPPIPEPLRALARIRHLNLFVSTTFDDLLERALNEERFAGAQRTEVIAYSPKKVPEDARITDQLASGRPGLKIDPDRLPLETNRAHALLFLGRTGEAEEIYRKYIGRKVGESGRTWEEEILNDFDELEKNGITHPEFKRIREILKSERH